MVPEWQSLQHFVKFSIVESRAGISGGPLKIVSEASYVRPHRRLPQIKVVEMGFINFKSYFT
jgi:hypothetical protein